MVKKQKTWLQAEKDKFDQIESILSAFFVDVTKLLASLYRNYGDKEFIDKQRSWQILMYNVKAEPDINAVKLKFRKLLSSYKKELDKIQKAIEELKEP